MQLRKILREGKIKTPLKHNYLYQTLAHCNLLLWDILFQS